MLAYLGAMLAYLEGNVGPSWVYIGASWGYNVKRFSCQGSKKAASPHSNSMAVKDGTGPPGDGLYCLTLLSEAARKLLSFCFCAAPGPSCSPFLLLLPDGQASNGSAARARKKRQLPGLEKSGFATLKQHGSEGRNWGLRATACTA